VKISVNLWQKGSHFVRNWSNIDVEAWVLWIGVLLTTFVHILTMLRYWLNVLNGLQSLI